MGLSNGFVRHYCSASPQAQTSNPLRALVNSHQVFVGLNCISRLPQGTHAQAHRHFGISIFRGGELFPVPADAQIATSTAIDGRRLFINAEPPVQVKLNPFKRTNVFLPRETPFAGRSHPAVSHGS